MQVKLLFNHVDMLECLVVGNMSSGYESEVVFEVVVQLISQTQKHSEVTRWSELWLSIIKAGQKSKNSEMFLAGSSQT